MSDLTITAESPTGGTRVTVVVQLVNDQFEPISAFNGDNILVSTYQGRTATDGTLTLDVTPNADLDVEDTSYVVTVGEFRRQIVKGAGSETLQDCVV